MRYLHNIIWAAFLMTTLSPLYASAEFPEQQKGEREQCRNRERRHDGSGGKILCQNPECRHEMKGQCGKRRGDWYGARKPVDSATDAHTRITAYFEGQEVTVSTVSEKHWGFEAEIHDKTGTLIDKVMIDKRSGRVRSIY